MGYETKELSTSARIATNLLQPAVVNSAGWPGQRSAHKPRPAWKRLLPAIGDSIWSLGSLCACGFRAQDAALKARLNTEQITPIHILRFAAVNSAGWSGQGGTLKLQPAWELPAPTVSDLSGLLFDLFCALGRRAEDAVPGHGATTTAGHQHKNNNKIGAQPWALRQGKHPPPGG